MNNNTIDLNQEEQKELIVKFHNDTNRVNLGNLGVNESQLFFAICSKLNNQGSATLTFDMPEIRTMMGGGAKTNKEITTYVKRLWENIKYANFWILLGNRADNIMLFRRFSLIFTDNTHTELVSIEVSVNDEFQYLLNNFIGNFTQFEKGKEELLEIKELIKKLVG